MINTNPRIKFSDMTIKVIDISVTLHSEVVQWPSSPKYYHQYYKTIPKKQNANVSSLKMSSHAGTHVDYPFHHIQNGKKSHESNLGRLLGMAQVIDFTHCEKAVTREDLEGVSFNNKADIVLLKTTNSHFWKNKTFNENFVYLTKEAATLLIDQDIKAVGIDYLSIDDFNDELKPVHQILLGESIIIIEGLNLAEVSAGIYFFVCLPLSIHDSEAAPARAILVNCSDIKGYLTNVYG